MIPPQQPNKGVPATPPKQPDQVEVPQDFELMEPNILEDIPDFIDIPEDMILDFHAWSWDRLSYQW